MYLCWGDSTLNDIKKYLMEGNHGEHYNSVLILEETTVNTIIM